MVYGVIYLIRCLVTGKLYVGQTKQKLQVRFRSHLREETYIGRAMRKYGIENFTVEVIEECYSREQLNERECYWIVKLNCKRPHGYNLTDGGEGTSGHSCTPERCLKMSVDKKHFSPYQILTAVLESLKITYCALAKKLGWHTSKLARKMRGERIFTLHQMMEIKELLGVDMPIEVLFQRTDGVPAISCPYAYPVLYRELQIRNITLTKLGEIVGLEHSNISAKMYGKFRFSVTEAEKTRNFLNIEMSVENLFRLADGSVPDFSHEPPPYVYPILANELKRQGITQKQISKHLGLSQAEFSRRMHGKPEFTPAQMEAIKKFLGTEMSVEELFKRNE